jgi:antitoxin component YwqK of YwqJK toxin-antitoxin module
MGLLDKFFGKKNRLDTRYYRNGQKKGEATFKNDKLDGLWTVWNEARMKASEGNWKGGKQNGLSTYWDEEGNVTKTET